MPRALNVPFVQVGRYSNAFLFFEGKWRWKENGCMGVWADKWSVENVCGCMHDYSAAYAEDTVVAQLVACCSSAQQLHCKWATSVPRRSTHC